jgi:hypothetical protein
MAQKRSSEETHFVSFTESSQPEILSSAKRSRKHERVLTNGSKFKLIIAEIYLVVQYILL